MPRSLVYLTLMLMIAAIGVANWRHEPSAPLVESTSSRQERRLGNCNEAIAAARRSPYWRNQSLVSQFAVDCRPAPGGWRLKASMPEPEELCELYVGRDRLIAPRLPCQGVGFLEHDLK